MISRRVNSGSGPKTGHGPDSQKITVGDTKRGVFVRQVWIRRKHFERYRGIR